ncbi:MAG: Holliday junction resolvase RuvX [Chlorobiaceae bacterium]|nr:Holliday junction resolvase RuvX [Chlorobiaceae bacterium]
MGFTLKKRVVAIDYGTKRIGVAQSDQLQLFAQPVGTFDRAGLSKTVQEMLRSDEIGKVLVGYPLSSNGETNTMTGVIDRFIEELLAEFPQLMIERIDEHHSSKDARKILAASGKSRKVRQEKGRVDSAAACVMLTDYLESINH